MQKGCSVKLQTQSDIGLTSFPFSITASEINLSGYDYKICFACTIKPKDLPSIDFSFDDISIKASPGGNCSDALKPKTFITIPEVEFNSQGDFKSVGTDY